VIHEFQNNRPAKARMNDRRGDMNAQAKPSKAASTLHASRKLPFWWKFDFLKRSGQQ